MLFTDLRDELQEKITLAADAGEVYESYKMKGKVVGAKGTILINEETVAVGDHVFKCSNIMFAKDKQIWVYE